MRISDWSSDVFSSDLLALTVEANYYTVIGGRALVDANQQALDEAQANLDAAQTRHTAGLATMSPNASACRSEEHTSELQSLMRISYAVFCLKKKKQKKNTTPVYNTHQPTKASL